jgi:DNA-binding LytR/AlgR family response regulator
MSSGLEAVKEVLRSFEVPVVFITAYPERLLTGERPEPTFLITKPFRPSMVVAIVSQALFFEQRARLKDRSSSPASCEPWVRHTAVPLRMGTCARANNSQ